MSDFDFSSAIAVLDTIATIANDVTKTRYDYVLGEKRLELQEEKWEHAKDTTEFNRNNEMLNDFHTRMNANMNQESFDEAYESLEDLAGTITQPRLQQKADVMLNSKKQVGQSIAAKDAWQQNVENIYQKYEGIQDEYKSDNFANTDHLAELAKEMREGVLANAKFFEQADNARFERLGMEIENYADAAKYIMNFDTDQDLTEFDIEQGYQELPVYNTAGFNIGNAYDEILKAVDLLKTGNINEGMRVVANLKDTGVGRGMHKDLKYTAPKMYQIIVDDMKAYKNNTSVHSPSGMKSIEMGKQYDRLNELHELNLDWSQKYAAAGADEKAIIGAADGDGTWSAALKEFASKKYTVGSDQTNYTKDMMALNAGLFNPTTYKTFKSEVKELEKLMVTDVVSEASNAVNTERTSFVNIVTNAIEEGTVDENMSGILTTGGYNFYPLLKSDSNKQIIRWDPAMEGPINLLEKTLSTFMGDPSGEGALTFAKAAGQGTGLFTQDNIYTAEDHNRIRTVDTDLAAIRKKQIAAFRIYNNMFWGGDETSRQIAEQVGFGGMGQSYGTADVEKGGLEVVRAAKNYYNKLFIQKQVSNWELGKNGGVPEVKQVLGNILTQMEAERKGIKAGLSKYKAYSGMPNGEYQRIEDIYTDMLNLDPNNEDWKAILRDMYHTKRHFSEKPDAENMYHPDHWKKISSDTALEEGLIQEVVDHIKDSPYGNKVEDWLDWYKKAETTDEERRMELERIRNDKLPWFLQVKNIGG